MDHIRILKRAFAVTTSYRALWIFGILLALTTSGRSGGSSGGGGNGSGTGSGPGILTPQLTPDMVTGLIVAGIVLLVVALLLTAVFIVLRYVSETALIRMVDQHEATGEKLTVRQGFRLGWSRAALRLFGLDLLVGLTVFLGFVLAALVAAAPLLVWFTESTPAHVLGTVVTIALGIVVIFALIVISLVISLVQQYWHRAVVLEGHGIRAALRRGWQLLRRRLGDNIIMGLIVFGLGLAWAIVLIPVVFLLLAVAAITGGLPALLVYAIAGLVAQGATPWIAAVIVGLPIFIAVLALPLLILGGLMETFTTTTWTLTYRELLALEAAAPAPSGNEPPATPAQLDPA